MAYSSKTIKYFKTIKKTTKFFLVAEIINELIVEPRSGALNTFEAQASDCYTVRFLKHYERPTRLGPF